jgi:hypothetical protein
MSEVIPMLFMYLLGLGMGFGAFVAYGSYQVGKLKKKRDELFEEVKKKAMDMESKTSSIRERLAEASKLAQVQADLRSQAEMPSKNSTHSRHKNGIISEIQLLEQQKLDILRTILAEGFNPVITVVHDGGAKQEVSLSEYVAAAQSTVDAIAGGKPSSSTPPPTVTEGSDLPRQVGKFFVYRGGKPDGTVH